MNRKSLATCLIVLFWIAPMVSVMADKERIDASDPTKIYTFMGGGWNLYLMLNVANTWDKGWEYWNGVGPSVTAQFIYDNESWWPGAQVRVMPSYTYFVSGELKDEGSGNVELNVGGEFTPTLMWDVTFI